ncbi:MAG TPA: efflux RND transporter periplasmic adaptor subunit [Woeseiaceae bacterium]|nr:efflux RND transporter periplasmic adaptor subunit [Woeseiaceae bacterium]
MTRKAMRIGLIVGILVAAVAVSALLTSFRKEPPKKPVENLAMLVEVVELEPVDARFPVRSQGTVRPRTETVLSAEISGAIVEISPKFIPGGIFAADEVLMRIDPTNYRVAVTQAEALVRQRQIEYEGARRLKSQGYRAESEYASAAAALATAEAELVRAKRNLERTYIRLPYAGMVRNKEADLGQFVNTGSRLGVTFAIDYAEVRLPLTDRDLAFVDLPYATAITATGESQGPDVVLSAEQRGRLVQWPAKIVRSEGVVDESSRVTYAVAKIDDPYALDSDKEPLPMGTFVTASIEGLAMEGLLRVPRYALHGSNQLLFIDSENRLRIRSVNIVRADAEYAYINGGAEAGERVILTAMESPINGMPVRIAGDERGAGGEKIAAGGGDDLP